MELLFEGNCKYKAPQWPHVSMWKSKFCYLFHIVWNFVTCFNLESQLIMIAIDKGHCLKAFLFFLCLLRFYPLLKMGQILASLEVEVVYNDMAAYLFYYLGGMENHQGDYLFEVQWVIMFLVIEGGCCYFPVFLVQKILKAYINLCFLPAAWIWSIHDWFPYLQEYDTIHRRKDCKHLLFKWDFQIILVCSMSSKVLFTS